MGVRILTSYETSEGFRVTEVYSRIIGFSFNMITKNVYITQNFYLSRDMRLSGKSLERVPFTSGVFTFQAAGFPTTVDMLYFHLKRRLTSEGFAVEDVLEPGQSPSTYSEPTAETDS